MRHTLGPFVKPHPVSTGLLSVEDWVYLSGAVMQTVVSVIDREHRILYVNQSFCDAFKTKPESLVGRTLNEVYSPDHVAAFTPILQRAFAGELVHYERKTQILGAEGKWFTVGLAPIFNAAKEVIAVMHSAMQVHDLVANAREMQAANERINAHFENSPLLVLELDEDLVVQRCSARLESLFGENPTRWIGRPLASLCDGHALQGSDTLIGSLTRLNRGEQSRNVIACAHLRPDGSTANLEWFNSALRDAQGKTVSIMALAQDISARMQVEEHLRSMATRDALTGLLNRPALFEHINSLLGNSNAKSTSITVLFIDLDDFKAVNDTYGHAVGDDVLRHVAAQLKNCCRPMDVLARLGGDEFVIVIERELSNDGVHSLATLLIEAVSTPLVLEGVSHRVGASIGIARHRAYAVSAVELIKQADAAMYDAKKSGKGRVQIALQDN